MNADVVVVVVEASYLKLLLMPPRLRINQLNFRKKIDLNQLKLVIAVVVDDDDDEEDALNQKGSTWKAVWR